MNIRHYPQNSKATSIREDRELFLSSLTLCYSNSFITSLTWSTQLATLPGKMGMVLTESFVPVAQFVLLFCHLLTYLLGSTIIYYRDGACNTGTNLHKVSFLQTLHEKLRLKKSVSPLLMSMLKASESFIAY